MVFVAVIAPCANAAKASTLIVPDDVPTLQAAFDARVDTVLVRAGIHDEMPIASDGIVLLGIEGEPGSERPAVSGLSYFADHSDNRELIVRNLTFNGQVRIANTGGGTSIIFEDCHFMRGIVDSSADPTTSFMRLLRCRIVGDASLNAAGDCVVDSCVVDGHLVMTHSEANMIVRDCVFRGDGTRAAVGSRPSGYVQSADVSRNDISGFGTGLMIGTDSHARIADNVVRDCTGIGIRVLGDVSASRNRVERCGSLGIEALGDFVITDNIISGPGDSGILASGEGRIVGNLIYGAGRHGLSIGGDGQAVEIRNNTLAYNRDSGVMFYAGVPYVQHQFTGNVGYENGRFGIEWLASGDDGIETPAVRCNVWFGNALGDIHGLSSSSEDFQLDPQFCDPMNGDFHLSASSPVVDLSRCGRIGALGVSCAAPGDRDAFRMTRVGPNPSGGPVTIDFEMPRAATIEVGVFDIQGRLIASPARGIWPAGRDSVSWAHTSDGAPIRPGLFLVRYRFPGGEAHRRIVRTP